MYSKFISIVAFAGLLAGCGGSGASVGSSGNGTGPIATATAPPAGSNGASPAPMPTATATPNGSSTTADVVIPSFPMPLTHSGRWMTDADGRVVIFHGINVAMKNPPYTPQGQGFTQADAAMLAREGFSSVRLWIWWTAFEPSPGVWDDTSLAATKQFIGWLNSYGITVRLNFAQVIWGQEFGGIGFPDWAADTDGLPLMNLGGDIEDGVAEPSVQAAAQNLYDNVAYPGTVGLADQFAAAWVHVASYFVNTPGVVAYDIFNEPEAGLQTTTCDEPAGCPVFDEETLTPFFEKTVAAIRTVDTVHMIQYEPYVLDAVGLFNTYVGAGSDPNLSLTFHYYPQTDDALTTTAPVAYQIFENDASTHNDAVELTEFGATDDLTQIGDILDAADQQKLGWLYWAWYSTEPTGNPATPTTETLNPQEGIVYDPTQPPVESNLKTAKLDVLDRPYPFLIAGTPQSWSFNTTTNVFTLTYTTTPVKGGAALTDPSVVMVPQRLYPSGYRVAVSGATVTSQPNANALTLATNTGATSITVTVSPNASSTTSKRTRNARYR
jgi:endoglycosylceramidase